jgi:conjugal transfer mating pair stabilization protein TraN
MRLFIIFIFNITLYATTCSNLLDLKTIASDMKWSYDDTNHILTLGTIADNYWHSSCGTYTRTTTFYIDENTNINDFTLIQTGFDDWIRITINGHRVYSAPYGDYWDLLSKYSNTYSDYCSPRCELDTSWVKNPNLQLKKYLIHGTNKIEMKVQVSGAGEGWMKFRVLGSYKKELLPTCPDEYTLRNGKCVYEKSYYKYLCSGSNEYGENYEPVVTSGDNSTPPKNNCKAKTFTCKSAPDRKCVWVDNKWQCSPFPCFGTNGDYAVKFDDTPTGVNDANNNGWKSDGSCAGQIYIFNGKDERCRSDDISGGLTGGGCCNHDKVFLGLVPCKEEEKLLDKNKEAEKCHYIGKYCSKKLKLLVGSICIQHKKTYCCFNSKLARIINEQGRSQLKRSWGTTKSPNCRGFKPEDFQKLDFSKMDLSEFYKDVSAKFSDSVQSNINTYIKNSVKKQLDR